MPSLYLTLFFSITEPDGNPHRLCLLSYKIPPGGVCVSAHGNSKSSKAPFYPTLPSTMELMKANARAGGPKQVLSVVSISVGGVVAATSPCDLGTDGTDGCFLTQVSLCYSSYLFYPLS